MKNICREQRNILGTDYYMINLLEAKKMTDWECRWYKWKKRWLPSTILSTLINNMPTTTRIGGSFALHRYMTAKGLSPQWNPQDIDIVMGPNDKERVMTLLSCLGMRTDPDQKWLDYSELGRHPRQYELPVVMNGNWVRMDIVPYLDMKTPDIPGCVQIMRGGIFVASPECIEFIHSGKSKCATEARTHKYKARGFTSI